MDNFRDSYFQVDWDLTSNRLRGTYWGKQYDTGRGFAVTVINGGQVVTATNEVLRLKWEKPDNTSGYVNATVFNGKFIVENIDQMFTVHGSVRADFELSVGGKFVASITFYVNVEKAVAVDAIESSSDFTALQVAIATTDNIDAQLADTIESISNFNSRVDEIITTPVDGNITQQEIIDARQGKGSLGANLTAIKKEIIEGEVIHNSDLGLEWVIGVIQSGNINPLATIHTTTENFIELDKPVDFKFSSPDKKYVISYYTNAGAYTGVKNTYTTDVTIPKSSTEKIRVSIGYNDSRLLDESEIETLVNSLTIIKEGVPTITSLSLKSLDNRVKTIEESVGGDNDNSIVIPEYWQSHLNSKIDSISTLQNQLGYNGTSFAFITDTHWENNSKNSPKLLRKIMEDCNIPYYFDGGDYASNPLGLTKEQQIEEIKDYKKAFSGLENRVLRTIGNHDDNSINNSYSKVITDVELYDVVFRQNSKYQHMKCGKTGRYYYIDDEMHKIRYITLDCFDLPYADNGDGTLKYSGMDMGAFRQDQIDWFADVALDVPNSEWGVIVCTHHPINTGTTRNDAICMNILQAFKDKSNYTGSGTITDFEVSKTVNYTNKGGDVICWISGHRHVDSFITLPASITFKVVVTANDNLGVKNGGPAKTAGTPTENCFDVFTINKLDRLVNITRVGAGVNRSFNY